MNPIYERRNAILRTLGFASYDDYLRSGLWASIRGRVIEQFKGLCMCCHKPATEVHHRRYTRENMSGKSLEKLIPVCRGCHVSVEFKMGRKVKADKVDRRLKRKLMLIHRANRAKKDQARKAKRKARMPNG